MQEIITEAIFHPSGTGYRFFLLHRPTDNKSPKGALLHVHAFAEEMNKSRRAVSLAARALAGRGWWVLQHDLLGCGDSSGDFGDATWSAWIEDVISAYKWLAERSGAAPALWGLRVGCLLAANAVDHLSSRPNLLFWQPVLSGRSFLNQFLRLRVAGDALAGSRQGASTKGLLHLLQEGIPISVAGYRIASNLALYMAQAECRIFVDRIGKVLLYEVASAPSEKSLSPGLTRKISEWQEAGCLVGWDAVDDLPFWQTQEIADGQGFLEATMRQIDSLHV